MHSLTHSRTYTHLSQPSPADHPFEYTNTLDGARINVSRHRHATMLRDAEQSIDLVRLECVRVCARALLSVCTRTYRFVCSRACALMCEVFRCCFELGRVHANRTASALYEIPHLGRIVALQPRSSRAKPTHETSATTHTHTQNVFFAAAAMVQAHIGVWAGLVFHYLSLCVALAHSLVCPDHPDKIPPLCSCESI